MSFSGSRRTFLKTGTLALLGSATAPRLLAAPEQGKLFSAMGIAAPLDKAAALKAAGAEFLTGSVGDFLVPDKPEADFEKNLEKYKDLPLPILACNGFIRPAHLKCVGPEANHDQILEWSETSFRRLKKAGGKFIVFGSAGARKLPDGWPREKADEQFVSLLKAMGPLAEKHGVKVTIEQLRREECNYINTISRGAELIRAAGHPNIRLLADLYHMASVGDTPDDLKAAMDVVVHMEIAEKEGRTVPGVSGDDFRPFFRVLRETKYQGAMSIEGKWSDEQLAPAFKEIAKQAGEV
ncbi:MAG: sugar phosphate isomerase/epimerase [Verrucomicrobiaceae bacterium]|nr:MAG: sugar phosphate isomerase/epimerase [Verrucomicrobiaceae bacterium]